MSVVDRIEELSDIDLHDPAAPRRHRLLPEAFQGLMRRPPGPEAIRTVLEVLFVDRFQDHDNRTLQHLILEGRNAPGALPPLPNQLRDSSPSPIRIIRSADNGSRSSGSAGESIQISSSDSLTGGMPPSP